MRANCPEQASLIALARLAEDRLEVCGCAENLLDKKYVIDAGDAGGGFGIAAFIAGAPRFSGGGVRVTF